MKQLLVIISFLIISHSLAAQFVVSGGSGTPLLAENDSRNHIEVYLLNGLTDARISIPSSSPLQWYKYDESALTATPVASQTEGDNSFITNLQDGYGYFIGEPADPSTNFVWIIDYSKYIPRFFGIETQEEEDKCEFLKILVDVEAEPLSYRLPSGAPATLTRTWRLLYQTMEWDDDLKQFMQIEKDITLKGIIAEIIIEAPLMNTAFTLKGDEFAEHFGTEQSIVSTEYGAVAVEVHVTAATDREYAENETHASGDILGGSAPVEYTFTVYANEPVATFFNWKMAKKDENTGEYVQFFRYEQKNLTYNFLESGDFKLSLEVSDRTLSCVDSTQIFNILIGTSKMEIPNVFSPGSSPGINDELRVSYASITNFKASVFNRWGNLLFRWTDPAKGWDGKVNGRYVPSGTYYVVVEYRDSTGKNRTASKAVNILKENDSGSSTNTGNNN